MIDALFGIFDGFGSLIGLFFYFLYRLIPNLGLCILLFLSAVMLILSPMSAELQKSCNDSIRIEPLRAEICEKYRGNSAKILEEVRRVRTENHARTSKKPLLLNFVLPGLLVIMLCSLVRHPISHVLRFPSGDIDRAYQVAKTIPLDRTTRDTASKEGIILAAAKRDKRAFYPVLGVEKTEQLVRFENRILGFDPGMRPSLQQKNLELNQYLRSLIIPGLCFLFWGIWAAVMYLNELCRIQFAVNKKSERTTAIVMFLVIVLMYSAFSFLFPLGAGLGYLVIVAFNAAESILFFILMNPAKVVPEQSRGL